MPRTTKPPTWPAAWPRSTTPRGAGRRWPCFAELAFEWFHPQHPAAGDVRALAEPIDGPLVTAVRDKARELGLVVVMNFFERDGDRTYDSSPVIDADGALARRHAHDPHHRVSVLSRAGLLHARRYRRARLSHARRAGSASRSATTATIRSTCARSRLGGADLVIVPQAGTAGEWPDGLYEGEMRVAALQNGYFVALCNRVGREDRLEFGGESFVCDPSGTVIARAGRGTDEILLADLDPAAPARSHCAPAVSEAPPAGAVCRVAVAAASRTAVRP